MQHYPQSELLNDVLCCFLLFFSHVQRASCPAESYASHKPVPGIPAAGKDDPADSE